MRLATCVDVFDLEMRFGENLVDPIRELLEHGLCIAQQEPNRDGIAIQWPRRWNRLAAWDAINGRGEDIRPQTGLLVQFASRHG